MYIVYFQKGRRSGWGGGSRTNLKTRCCCWGKSSAYALNMAAVSVQFHYNNNNKKNNNRVINIRRESFKNIPTFKNIGSCWVKYDILISFSNSFVNVEYTVDIRWIFPGSAAWIFARYRRTAYWFCLLDTTDDIRHMRLKKLNSGDIRAECGTTSPLICESCLWCADLHIYLSIYIKSGFF